jgi:rare lipoprotein A (peptidoglycan hydrolase)
VKIADEKKPVKPKREEPVVKENKEKIPETQPQQTPVVKDKPAENINTPAAGKSSINFNGGKFKSLYADQIKNKTLASETGTAATFKTTSGWQDGKYYCFHNTATPGTIVKITNTVTGKSIYAKVIDAIPDIKQNGGLLLRVSNSAAEELGAGDNKFDCSVMYAK